MGLKDCLGVGWVLVMSYAQGRKYYGVSKRKEGRVVFQQGGWRIEGEGVAWVWRMGGIRGWKGRVVAGFYTLC